MNIYITLILIAITLGVAIFAALKYLNLVRILHSINKLTIAAKKIANGEIDIKKDVDSYLAIKGNSKSTEIENLQAAIKDMLEEIASGEEHAIRLKLFEFENEKLQAVNAAKTNFFSNMSHEIRTPMNSIFGVSQILLNDDNLTETQVKYIEEIKEAADILLSIVNDILDLSKLETGKLTLVETDFNFIKMIDDLTASTRFLATKKKLQFNYVPYGELPRVLFGDEPHIRQILINLLNNAVKYTTSGSVTLRVDVRDTHVIYTIEDTGLGIPQQTLDELFQPFKQFETNSDRGTGLGLAIVKQLCDIMNASISVKSEIGTGSTFTVTLPKVLGDAKNIAEDIEVVGFSAQKARILIVDDNDINLHVAAGLIETLYKVVCDKALSGEEAIQKVKMNSYDLIFMDHMMPVMDGIETTAAIRQLGGKFASLPIIALTANALIGTKEILIKGGMNDFLSKPIQQKDLHSVLVRYLPNNKINVDKAFLDENENVIEKSSFVKTLAEIRGIDIGQALSNVANREDILEKSMKILLLKIPTQIEEIKDLLERNNMKGFTLLTHTIKGSFSNCGLMFLSKLAARLSKESEVDNYAYCRENTSFFIEKLEDLETELTNIFNTFDSQEEKPEGSPEQLEKTKYALIDALEDYNYTKIVEFVGELQEFDYGPVKNDIIKRLTEKVSYFDYNGTKEATYTL
ncbi:hypothetical protein FACS1894132_04540 [Clostridia bacterium]|nr:hypothetical protein FACS1894132_04540 [Clostridia bacterium]